jgi:L-2-aminoadipate reductase
LERLYILHSTDIRIMEKMEDDRLARVVARLQNLPSISLPSDYPRPSGPNKLVEVAHSADLSEQTCLSLIKLTLYSENGDDDDEAEVLNRRPTGFQLLLAAFTVLLHRYTGDTDLVIGSSSAYARDPLVLRLPIDPKDPFWEVVRQVQQVEKEAEADALPFERLTQALNKNNDDIAEGSRPLFRVRFFDETDEPKDNFIRSTSLTSDLTVFITRPPISTRATLAARISLRILYNSLLFTPARISAIVDQLSVFLRKVASNPLAPVGSVPLLTSEQRIKLPDPTGDLDWCGWKGAITDIFSRNARQWPDRPCVLQSIPSPTSPGSQEVRTYSYGTIRHVSNVLAHHLLQAGVQREEVVMVYAHRSVELVVAVMAILKIGATFSVIGSPASSYFFHVTSADALYRSSLPGLATDNLLECGTTARLGCA